jgi:hypothetical protein
MQISSCVQWSEACCIGEMTAFLCFAWCDNENVWHFLSTACWLCQVTFFTIMVELGLKCTVSLHVAFVWHWVVGFVLSVCLTSLQVTARTGCLSVYCFVSNWFRTFLMYPSLSCIKQWGSYCCPTWAQQFHALCAWIPSFFPCPQRTILGSFPRWNPQCTFVLGSIQKHQDCALRIP